VTSGERRRHPRYPESVHVLYLESEGSGEACSGRIKDLSEGGVCLVTSRELSVGAQLYLGVFLDSL
jgi:hypothetical protein